MRSEQNKMDNNPDDQLIISQANIESNRQDYDYKMNIYDSKLDKITALVKNMMHQNKNSSPDKVESLKAQGYDTYYLVTSSLMSFK